MIRLFDAIKNGILVLMGKRSSIFNPTDKNSNEYYKAQQGKPKTDWALAIAAIAFFIWWEFFAPF